MLVSLQSDILENSEERICTLAVSEIIMIQSLRIFCIATKKQEQ